MVKKYGTSCHKAFAAIREDRHPNNGFAKTVLQTEEDICIAVYSYAILYVIFHNKSQPFILLYSCIRICSHRETLNSRMQELCLEDSIENNIAGYKVYDT